ncbi:hypothetical protein AB4Y45_34705 [Paraburkholderia sp. EG287A]|uniref:hypothetical protein n=1 Tax=Paraburkholderia sp. EG287A TaxID=3237012 RepID=UPI0034D240C8
MKFVRRVARPRHQICCPSCKEPVLLVWPNRLKVPFGRYWLRDGDCIGPLYHRLSEAQRDEAYSAELMVGGCRSCGEDFYVATVSLMAGSYEEKQDYLLFNRALGPQRNYLCQRPDGAPDVVPGQWLLTQYRTDAGVMHEHTFGPWPLKKADGVEGSHGVSCCGVVAAGSPWEHVTDVLSPIWGTLREMLEAAR